MVGTQLMSDLGLDLQEQSLAGTAANKQLDKACLQTKRSVYAVCQLYLLSAGQLELVLTLPSLLLLLLLQQLCSALTAGFGKAAANSCI